MTVTRRQAEVAAVVVTVVVVLKLYRDFLEASLAIQRDGQHAIQDAWLDHLVELRDRQGADVPPDRMTLVPDPPDPEPEPEPDPLAQVPPIARNPVDAGS